MFGLPILYVTFLFGSIIYFFDPLEEPTLLFYGIIAFHILFVILAIIDGYYERIILTDNCVIKKSPFKNKSIEFDKIIELEIYKLQNYAKIKGENLSFRISWKYYEKGQEFKIKLNDEVEKRNIPIV